MATAVAVNVRVSAEMTSTEGGTQPTDPRVEKAATRAHVWLTAAGGVNRSAKLCAQDILASADAADREAGIVRIQVDDGTVERVARAIQIENPSVAFAIGKRTARAVLAALTGEQS